MTCALFSTALVLALGPMQDDSTKQGRRLLERATYEAVRDAMSSLGKVDFSKIPSMAVLVFENDAENDFSDLLTTELVKSGKTRVVARQAIDRILAEHRFVLRHEDLFDPATIRKLGGWLSVKALLYGSVKEATVEGKRAFVSVRLKLVDVDTATFIWADAIRTTHPASVAEKPEEPRPRRGLLTTERDLLVDDAFRKAFTSAAASLSRLEGARTVLVLPLQNDETGAATELLSIALTRTGLRVTTRAGVDEALRKNGLDPGRAGEITAEQAGTVGKALQVQLILCGSVTAVSVEDAGARVRANLRLVDAASGELVWGEAVEGRAPTVEEPGPEAAAPGERPAPAGEDEAPLRRKGPVVWIAVVGGLVLLAAFGLIVGLGRKETPRAPDRVSELVRWDEAIRNKIVRGLAQGRRELEDALAGGREAKSGEDLRSAMTAVRSLSEKIGNAPVGNLKGFREGSVSTAHLERVADFERTIDELVQDVTRACRKVREAASGADPNSIAGGAKSIRKLCAELENRYKAREDILSGI